MYRHVKISSLCAYYHVTTDYFSRLDQLVYFFAFGTAPHDRTKDKDLPSPYSDANPVLSVSELDYLFPSIDC